MTPEAVDRAARLLFEARRARRVLPGLPADCAPRTVEDGYAVQERLIALLGEEIGGWYCACTNPEIQEKLGLDQPYSARLLKSALRPSPATLSLGDLASPPVLEVEFAFSLARALPPRAWPYGLGEVADAVAAVHPSIEVVRGHIEDWPDRPAPWIIADNGVDGALVYGEARADWRDLDLAALEVTLTVNGEIVRRGAGADVLGNPLHALVWLANQRATRGEGLEAGHIHNTGTATSMYWAGAGDEAVADFGPLGEARVSLAP